MSDRGSDATLVAAAPSRPSLSGHLEIARVDHWFKNVFVLPGIVIGLGFGLPGSVTELAARIILGLLATCLVASSNYTVNEVMDASFDRHHPSKRLRAVPAGRVSVPLAYGQWIVLMIAGIGVGLLVSRAFAATMAALWLMGCLYNIPPVRTKDVPYIDVLSEAINNPLRLLAGWFIVGPMGIAPASLLLSYWMAGSYFMALKRYAEHRDIASSGKAAAYRRSFGYYTPERLLVSITFYSSAAMLFLGAFAMRYRLELMLSFPLIALVMALYLRLSFRPGSPVQQPEGLYREPSLMLAVVACTVVMSLLLFIDIPALHEIFLPTPKYSTSPPPWPMPMWGTR